MTQKKLHLLFSQRKGIPHNQLPQYQEDHTLLWESNDVQETLPLENYWGLMEEVGEGGKEEEREDKERQERERERER